MFPVKPLLLCLFIFLLSCNRSTPIKTTEFTGNAMTINYRIVVGSSLTEQQKAKVESIIQTTFEQINALYNKWNYHSEISILNRLPAHTPTQLSPELYSFLQLTDKIVKASNGRFDPTIEPIQALWKTHLQQGTLPTDTEIASLKPAIGWDKVHFDGGIFTKDHDGLMIDLGGIAKGYAVDLLTENLVAEQIPSLYVEWGGEIKAHGKHPYKRPWRVYISHFEDTNANKAIAIVELEDVGLATSGDYLQKWKVGEEEYFHIIDPFSLHVFKIGPHTIGSASIACNSCAIADGIATAALTFSTEEEASKWLDSLQADYPELRYWLLSRSTSETR